MADETSSEHPPAPDPAPGPAGAAADAAAAPTDGATPDPTASGPDAAGGTPTAVSGITAAELPGTAGTGDAQPPSKPPPPHHHNPPSSGLRAAIIGGIVGALVAALVSGGIFYLVDDNGGTTTTTRIVQQGPTPVIARPSTSIPAGANDIASIVAKAEPAIVAITTDGGPTSGNGGAGTGFVIAPDGYIATNNHVVEGAKKIQAQFTSGRIVDAQLVGRDPSTDLAVIKVDGSGLPAVELGNSDTVQIGDAVVAIGNALALEGGLSVTNGIISALNRQVPEQNGAVLVGLLQTDAAINPGNSGGPLLDSQGRVIGINTAIANPGQAQNIGFAIPISKASPVFTDLRSGRKPAFLGVSTQDLTPALTSQLNLTITQGAVVNQVSSGTPAAAAGLRKNDVIVQIDQAPIKGSADVQTAIRAHQPGDTVAIVVQRGTQRLTLHAKLTQRPTVG